MILNALTLFIELSATKTNFDDKTSLPLLRLLFLLHEFTQKRLPFHIAYEEIAYFEGAAQLENDARFFAAALEQMEGKKLPPGCLKYQSDTY